MKNRMFIVLLSLVLSSTAMTAQVTFDTINAGIPGFTADWYWDNSTVLWGDYDNDEDLDILLTGTLSGGVVKVMRNDTNDVFTDIGGTFAGCNGQSAIWLDYDRDGDLDIFATSQNGFTGFQNSGNGVFTQVVTISGYPGSNRIGWIDYDNDGDADIVLASNGLRIFENNSGMYASGIVVADLKNVECMQFCDIDNDGDTDIIASGGRDVVYNGDTGPLVIEHYFTQIMQNDNGVIVSELEITDFQTTYIDEGDYNCDGNAEITLGGTDYFFWPDGMGGWIYSPMGDRVTRYSHLSGLDNLDYEVFGNPAYGSVHSGDLNNDGQLDFIGSGWYYMNSHNVDATRIFISAGNQIIENALSYAGVSNSKIDFWDYNNDGKLDLIITGRGVTNNQPATYLLKNTSSITQNSNPSPPTNLRTEDDGNFVKLIWDAANDTETLSLGLSYNIKIGTTPGGQEVMTAMAENDGSRLVSGKGLVNGNCFWKIHKSMFQNGSDYYFSVQAIDNNYKGSVFTAPCLIPLPDPQIELVESESINFGDTYSGTSSGWSQIVLRCTGLGLLITDIYLKHDSPCFQIDQSSMIDFTDFGSLSTIAVRFSPSTPGSQVDTLCVISNAINQPLIEITLSGKSVYVPPLPPDNVSVVVSNADVQISWQLVDTDILGHPVSPDGYVILYNEIPNDDEHFWYLGFTESNSFTHYYVNNYRDSMFYKVVAVVFYQRDIINKLKTLSDAKSRYKWIQVKKIITDIDSIKIMPGQL